MSTSPPYGMSKLYIYIYLHLLPYILTISFRFTLHPAHSRPQHGESSMGKCHKVVALLEESHYRYVASGTGYRLPSLPWRQSI